KLDNFQFILNNFPIKYPPPNAVSNVNIITIKEYLPTFNTWVKLRVNPNKIIENFNTRFETNWIPSLKIGYLAINGFKAIPINNANTLPLMMPFGTHPLI